MGNETRRVLDALRNRHIPSHLANNGRWVYAEEVRISTGWGGFIGTPQELLGTAEQRIDAYAAHAWPSKKGLRVAYEVKVTMSDLRRELQQPWKANAALFLSNEFYLVVPTEMPALPSLPGAWGVIRVGPRGGLRTTIPAPHRDTPLPPYSFMLSLARRIQANGG